MVKICKECAKKGEKVYMKIVRKAISMILYSCRKCKKKVIINIK